MHRARIVAELTKQEVSEERVLTHFFSEAGHAD